MTSQKQLIKRHGARLTRARIRHVALTQIPLRLTGGLLRRVPSVTNFKTTRRTVALPQLPGALDGMRIAHLSDLHIGELIHPHRLPRIIDATNALRADLIAVTGDFVDLDLDVLSQVTGELRRLTAHLGVFLVPGNHDHLVNGPHLISRFRAAGLNLLVNEHRQAIYRGCQVTIGGIDFAHTDSRLGRFVARSFRDLPGRGGQNDLRLLLAHHPHAFDAARHHEVDLTLAGHTHGGQVVFSSRRSRKGSIGLASFAFRYPRGLYRCNGRYLHVTCGVGSWFPLRVKCPPEVACLTLRREREVAPHVLAG